MYAIRSYYAINFLPDPEVFTETVDFDYDVIKVRARELALLNKGVKIILKDDRNDKKDEFLFNGGISEYVALLNKNKELVHEEIVDTEGESDGITVEVAMQYIV